MRLIDGSAGSGGGQILRTALALSAYTREPFEIREIRADRPNPGLARQHLKCVEAVAELCGAEVEGAELGSGELVFEPGTPHGGRVEVDIGTAGSVTLLLQAALIPAAVEGATLRVVGGTDVKWSPAWDYFEGVMLPLAERWGLEASTRLERRGYYPRGGGVVEVEVDRWEPRTHRLESRGELLRVEGVSHVSDLPLHIAERQAASAEAVLRDVGSPVEIDVRSEDGSTGTGITLRAIYEETVLGGSALGERGKPAEEVGAEAAKSVLREIRGDGAVDRFAGDQLVPLVALGGGRYTVSGVTDHLETNVSTTLEFLPGSVTLEGDGAAAVKSRK